MSLWKLFIKKCLAFFFLFPCFSSFWPGGVLSVIFSSQLENGKKGEVSQRKCKQKCKVSPQKRQIATCNPQQLKRKFNSDTRQLKVHFVSYGIGSITAATGFWTIIWHTLRLDLTFAFGLLSTSFAANRKFRQQTGP